MIQRNTYLDQLLSYVDKPYIKVITGIRRCGKSAMMMLLRDELRNRGILDEEIIYLNFESFEYANIDDATKLYAHVQSRLTGKKRHYILLDEVQEVVNWEKAVNAFLVDFNTDIYITGSNSRILSSELATYLAGRYVEVHMHTLSFAEYLSFTGKDNVHDQTERRNAFARFLRYGGFPVIHLADYSLETAHKIVFDIYSSAILRDTIQRHHIRDVELLERVVKFVFENIGNKFSAKNVADYFKSQQRKIDLNTVYNYLNALENAYIVYRIPRYDIKGREVLKTYEKYYVADQSLIYSLLGIRDRYISGILENVVMLELLRRGYRVYVGKMDQKEVDFIAERKDTKLYIQVAYKLSTESTVDREFSPLLSIRDHHPKYVITMDEDWTDNIQGVQHMHIADFLMQNGNNDANF